MKILLVHNDYGKYSGEEAVVDKMSVMLKNLGYDVAQFRMSTEGARDSLAGKILGFVAGIYCPKGIKAMREALKREQPDVVNVHNLYPFISPTALRECKNAGIPVVMTVHNFRLMCPTGLFMRNGTPCELCLENGNEWGCVRYNCEHSMLKSIGYAARNAVARINRHYLDCVDRFACITDFQRRKLITAGFPSEKIIVIPNSVDVVTDASPTVGDYVAYSGRLSYEKGVDLIIEVARRNPNIPFKLAGAARDSELIANLPKNVQFMGYLSGLSLEEFYGGARFFVMASRCYEGFPMAILESARYFKPMIAPNHGGFTEIIGKNSAQIGKLFPPSDLKAFEKTVLNLWEDEAEVYRLGQLAHKKLINEYSVEVISKKWNDLLEIMVKR